MGTTTMAPEELLERATELAKSHRDLELMDRTALLHGYVEISRLDPANGTYRKNVDDAAASLMGLVVCWSGVNDAFQNG